MKKTANQIKTRLSLSLKRVKHRNDLIIIMFSRFLSINRLPTIIKVRFLRDIVVLGQVLLGKWLLFFSLNRLKLIMLEHPAHLLNFELGDPVFLLFLFEISVDTVQPILSFTDFFLPSLKLSLMLLFFGCDLVLKLKFFLL